MYRQEQHKRAEPHDADERGVVAEARALQVDTERRGGQHRVDERSREREEERGERGEHERPREERHSLLIEDGKHRDPQKWVARGKGRRFGVAGRPPQ